jgi:predicted DNA-binding transcriptional regulator AlpA
MVKAKRRTSRRPASTSIDSGTVPDLPVTGLLRIAQVLKYVPISRTSWWLGVREGRFPQPQKLGNVPVWRVSDIRDLIDHGERRTAATPPSSGAVHASG